MQKHLNCKTTFAPVRLQAIRSLKDSHLHSRRKLPATLLWTVKRQRLPGDLDRHFKTVQKELRCSERIFFLWKDSLQLTWISQQPGKALHLLTCSRCLKPRLCNVALPCILLCSLDVISVKPVEPQKVRIDTKIWKKQLSLAEVLTVTFLPI